MTGSGQGWTLLGGLAVVCAGAALAVDRSPPAVLINESPSLPKGVYMRLTATPLQRGSIVATPQPAAARPYLARLGMPADVLLLKRVAAVGGDRVCSEGDGVATPTGRVAVRAKDRRGAALGGWGQCRVLAADEVFLLGDTAASFDSRYFGPVRRDDITGVYREMMTW